MYIRPINSKIQIIHGFIQWPSLLKPQNKDIQPGCIWSAYRISQNVLLRNSQGYTVNDSISVWLSIPWRSLPKLYWASIANTPYYTGKSYLYFINKWCAPLTNNLETLYQFPVSLVTPHTLRPTWIIANICWAHKSYTYLRLILLIDWSAE